MKKKHTKKNDEYYKLNKKTIGFAILALAVIVILIALYYQGVFDKFLPEQEEQVQEIRTKVDLDLKAEVKLTVITVDCEDCIDAKTAAGIIKDAPMLDVTEEEYLDADSDEGKAAIEKYDLKRLPAFILSGKELKLDLPTFREKDGDYVFDETPPPYYDVATSQIKGRIEVIKLVDPDCEECFDLSKLVNNLNQFGIKITSEKTVPFDSEEGKKIIEDYSITKIPTIIFSDDAKEYDQINQIWETVGSTESDGKMVLRTVNPPYKDLETNQVVGVVDITHLVDASCEECFDTAEIKKMFEAQMGMSFGTETTVDISSEEGKDLIEQFDIKLVPTVIFSDDLGDYPTVPDMWTQIGIEKDGNYVLTKIDMIQGVVYKNLETGELVGLKEEKTEEPAVETTEDNTTGE